MRWYFEFHCSCIYQLQYYMGKNVLLIINIIDIITNYQSHLVFILLFLDWMSDWLSWKFFSFCFSLECKCFKHWGGKRTTIFDGRRLLLVFFVFWQVNYLMKGEKARLLLDRCSRLSEDWAVVEIKIPNVYFFIKKCVDILTITINSKTRIYVTNQVSCYCFYSVTVIMYFTLKCNFL